MKVIEAVWEKRNLDINCLEIHVDKMDSMEQVRDTLKKYCEQYMVIKLPILRMDLCELLLEEQYCFVETMFSLENKITEYCLPKKKKSLANKMSYNINNTNSQDRINLQIRAGMFNTDRISVDKFFSAEQSAKRYIGMIQDEFMRGAELMEFVFQDEPFGFSCFRKISDEHYYQSLVGVYPKYHNKGLGFAIAYLPIKELLERGGKIITTGVSSNNKISLYTHLHNGFMPKDIEYLFIKHN